MITRRITVLMSVAGRRGIPRILWDVGTKLDSDGLHLPSSQGLSLVGSLSYRVLTIKKRYQYIHEVERETPYYLGVSLHLVMTPPNVRVLKFDQVQSW